jgi:hypothetical protein
MASKLANSPPPPILYLKQTRTPLPLKIFLSALCNSVGSLYFWELLHGNHFQYILNIYKYYTIESLAPFLKFFSMNGALIEGIKWE